MKEFSPIKTLYFYKHNYFILNSRKAVCIHIKHAQDQKYQENSNLIGKNQRKEFILVQGTFEKTIDKSKVSGRLGKSPTDP